jgi:hypothetical protein
MDRRAPERFVDVDVPHPGKRSLVEQRGLDRRAPSLESLSEAASRERPSEWLRPDPRHEVGLELLVVNDEPCAEASNVAVNDVRSVV